MAGSLVAFLIFNHSPARIFMGDSGSLMIGLVNSILVIKFINVASSQEVVFPIASAVAVGFAILIVPLLDTLRVFSIRIFNRRSPFTPDRNHVHHLLLDRGLNHTSVTVILTVVNISFVFFAYMAKGWGPTWVILAMVLAAFSGLGLLYYSKPRRKLVVAKGLNGKIELKPASKVVTFTKEKEAATAE
jgi:UDP-N-acetylmuramyl pentapeptide phosphotransferase/UDP-N-acetylglucosamine-1-phosphate transferase